MGFRGCHALTLLLLLLLLLTLHPRMAVGRTRSLALRSRARRHNATTLEETASGSSDRELLGPGSSPPKCTSKCGRCTPCRPVHVPIQPAALHTAEYYPEAWRCKCGNKLYMP